jgi:hypothetical protein
VNHSLIAATQNRPSAIVPNGIMSTRCQAWPNDPKLNHDHQWLADDYNLDSQI